MNGKFELYFGHVSNGITLYNKAIKECGYYKKIGKISETGKVTLYIKKESIPWEDLHRIVKASKDKRSKFIEKWNKLSLSQKYYKLIDMIPCDTFTNTINAMERMDVAQRVEVLEKVYI